MNVFAALAAVEQVLLYVVADGEERAAGCVVTMLMPSGQVTRRMSAPAAQNMSGWGAALKRRVSITNRWRLAVQQEQRPRIRGV